jgi:2-dehydro-3-deoxyphosphogluconate aldolase/(4S)-4-hydroxy-2-oxoglutarate aldolase
MLAKHFEGRMFIGAGTVLNEKQVKLTRDAGGLFIISPDTNDCVIKKSVELGMVSIPGALTPSEITAAHRAGADFIKLFPITNMGIEYVKAVRAPLSHLKLLAVGGVTLENINEYLDTGVCGFGISSGIVDKKLIAAKDFDGITALAKSYVEKL